MLFTFINSTKRNLVIIFILSQSLIKCFFKRLAKVTGIREADGKSDLRERHTTLYKTFRFIQPKILYLDEPAAGMNPQETKELTKLIDHIREKYK